METLAEWHERATKEQHETNKAKALKEASRLKLLNEVITDFNAKRLADKSDRAAKRKLKHLKSN
jgi:hypothetical protein